MYRLSPVIEESFSELNSENSSFIENDKSDIEWENISIDDDKFAKDQ